MSNKWINEMAQQMRSGEWKEGEDPELYCAKFREKPCDIIEIAKGLSGQLKETVERLPANLDWDDDTPYPVILAEIRHQYTNYDEVIAQLPECGDPTFDEYGSLEDCSNHTEAHDIIKWAAKTLAERLFEGSNA